MSMLQGFGGKEVNESLVQSREEILRSDQEGTMKAISMRMRKLLTGFLIVALILAVSVFTDFGLGNAAPAEADGGSKTRQVEGFGYFGGGVEAMGVTWSGID